MNSRGAITRCVVPPLVRHFVRYATDPSRSTLSRSIASGGRVQYRTSRSLPLRWNAPKILHTRSQIVGTIRVSFAAE